MTIANNEIGSTRQVVVKSPNSSFRAFPFSAFIQTAPFLLEESKFLSSGPGLRTAAKRRLALSAWEGSLKGRLRAAGSRRRRQLRQAFHPRSLCDRSVGCPRRRSVLIRRRSCAFRGPFFPEGIRSARLQHRTDRVHQRSPLRSQFDQSLANHFFQQFFAPRLQHHEHLPPVLPSPHPSHVASRLQPIYQLNHAMVAQQQPLRQRADRRFESFRQPANRQQQQVLLRFEPRVVRGIVAFLQEPPDPVPQFRQGLIFLVLDLWGHKSFYRVTIYLTSTLDGPFETGRAG